MVKITVFVEGGGGGKDLKSRCREGFSKFFAKAGLVGRMPSVVACGPRGNAFDRFCKELKFAKKDELPLLLVDSEDAVSSTPWTHLKQRDNWDRPEGAKDCQCHLMVQIMESWFLADRLSLATFFKQGFRESALPNEGKIESISKAKVSEALSNATRACQTGAYSKSKHSFALLGKINPQIVRDASPHAERLLQALSTQDSSS